MVEAKKTTTAAKKPAAKKASTTTAKPAAKASATKSTEVKAPAKAAAKTTATKSAATTADKSAKVKSAATKKSAQESNGGLLKLHHLKPADGAKTAKTRVGRGEASKGKTAGRGTKGTKARYQIKVGFEGGQMPLHMRLPKLRGFKNPFRTEFQVVNLDRLEKAFPKGGKVSIEDLVKAGLVRDNNLVKVLGDGEVTQKFDITADKFSKTAVEKIEKAGGSVTTTEGVLVGPAEVAAKAGKAASKEADSAKAVKATAKKAAK
ncbi:hypothetical protein FACS1894125_2630 [Actinomycetota bacterium]|nr:hypothetical protein FACS1894125_2630 [Actinomycetota bacterium]